MLKKIQQISSVEKHADILFDEIEENKNIRTPVKVPSGTLPRKSKLTVPAKLSVPRSSTLPRKPKSSDFYHGRSDSDSSNDSGFEPIRGDSIHHQGNFRKPNPNPNTNLTLTLP